MTLCWYLRTNRSKARLSPCWTRSTSALSSSFSPIRAVSFVDAAKRLGCPEDGSEMLRQAHRVLVQHAGARLPTPKGRTPDGAQQGKRTGMREAYPYADLPGPSREPGERARK